MKVSVIIPTYNEADHIGALLDYLNKCPVGERLEILVADGGSTDGTTAIASTAGAQVVASSGKGRAIQMNAGARAATGHVLYFLHADSYPPPGFIHDITQAVRSGYGSGCYRLVFDHRHWFLALNCWFTRFDVNAFRFGDQSLFVGREDFNRAGGFREDLIVMEDQEIIPRLRKYGRFIILPGSVTTSARKYLENGIYKTQAVFFLIYGLYKAGVSQQKLVATYRRLLEQPKL